MAVISENQDKFLQPLDGSRRLNKDVFPIKQIASSVIQGFKQIVNEYGTRPKGCYGKWAWDMFRAAIGGCLERTAIMFTRSADNFHTIELQGGNAQTTEFSECHLTPPEHLRVNRNVFVSERKKRRWRYDVLMSQFISWCRSLAFLDYRVENRGSWYIIPPIMTTAYTASGLFSKDLDNSKGLIDTSSAAAKFGGSEGLQKYPAGEIGDDKLISVLSRNGLYFDVPSERVNGEYPYAEEYCASERDIVFDSSVYDYCRRRSGSRMAGALNFMDLMRIGCWVGDAAYEPYDWAAERNARSNFHKEGWRREISLAANWNEAYSEFQVSIADGSAYLYDDDYGRYVKYKYEEGIGSGGGGGFTGTRWASLAETLRAALYDYFSDPNRYAWMAGYFSLVEDRVIPQSAEYWKGENGTFVWFEAEKLYSFLMKLSNEGYVYTMAEELSGGLQYTKDITGIWTDSDGEYGSSYFGDIDYPCSYAIKEQYVAGSQEYMFGIGRLDVEVFGSEHRYYDALKDGGGSVIEHRIEAASVINKKFINDCFNILDKEAGGNLVSTKQEMIDWMNAFKFSPNANSPAYDNDTLIAELEKAQAQAQWVFTFPFFCVVGGNAGNVRFSGFAGLFGANELGASDNKMTSILPRKLETDILEMYSFMKQHFTAPIWYRDMDSSAGHKDNFSAQGEIESWIGAFDWEWKSITHD